VIEARGVEVTFSRGWRKRRRFKALDGLDLEVAEGDVFGIIGPNGSGKSTAMHSFLGLIQPDRGEIRLMGERPHPGAAMYERVAYLPEEPHYHLYLTVEEAVGYYTGLYRQAIDRRRVRRVIEEVGLGESRKLLLRKCSKGMKQKVGIAVCLARSPEVVFLDEPMRGLDPQAVKQFREALLTLNARGSTIVLNSHILPEVQALCHRAAILRQGRVVRQDTIDNLMTQDLDRYVVEIDPVDPLPECLTLSERHEERLTGTVPTDRIGELFRDAQTRGYRVRSSTYSRLSLEEAFFDALGDEG
jgi:ABC-2 type transport system ATP-binding protein